MVSPQELREISVLLDEALALPAAQRNGWIDALPGEAARLAPALRSLLQHAGQGQVVEGDERRVGVGQGRRRRVVSAARLPADAQGVRVKARVFKRHGVFDDIGFALFVRSKLRGGEERVAAQGRRFVGQFQASELEIGGGQMNTDFAAPQSHFSEIPRAAVEQPVGAGLPREPHYEFCVANGREVRVAVGGACGKVFVTNGVAVHVFFAFEQPRVRARREVGRGDSCGGCQAKKVFRAVAFADEPAVAGAFADAERAFAEGIKFAVRSCADFDSRIEEDFAGVAVVRQAEVETAFDLAHGQLPAVAPRAVGIAMGVLEF